METITGVVQGVYDKQTKTGKTVWHAIINGKDINMAFDKPAFNVGDTATVEYEETRWGPQIVKTGKPTAGRTGPSKGGGFRPEDPKKQLSIARQNALGHATAIVLASTDPLASTASATADEVIRIAHKLTKFSTLEMDDNLLES